MTFARIEPLVVEHDPAERNHQKQDDPQNNNRSSSFKEDNGYGY